MKYKVAFRTDGNSTIGMGHITRCLSIALAVRHLGFEPIFLLSDSAACDLLEQNKIDYEILNIDYKEIDDDVNLIHDFLKENQVEIILVDSYFASDHYLENLMRITHVACIDGLYKYETAIDVIINYNAAATISYYENRFYEKQTKLLIGNQYVPLKPEYWDVGNVDNPQFGNKVLITTGATDSLDICGNLLSLCQKRELLEKLDVTVVVGSFFNYEENLLKKWGDYRNIQFIKNCNNLMPLMQETNIAVSAGGTTIYELLCLEIPSILFAMTDIQRTIEALSDKVDWIGDIREQDHGDVLSLKKLENIVGEMQKLCFCEDEYMKIKKNCQGYIDGQGALRIANALVQI